MESLILEIQKKMAGKVSDFTVVEEYYGQLEQVAGVYPVRFPCAFVQFLRADWVSEPRKQQHAEVLVEVIMAFDCKQILKPWKKSEEKTRERFQTARNVNTLLHGQTFGDSFGALTRINTRSEHLSGDVRVIRHTYRCTGKDAGATDPLIAVKVDPALELISE